MFYSTLCLKMSAYFQDVFELNTAELKLLQLIPIRAIGIAQTRSLAKQSGNLFTYFQIIIMIREYPACFILHSASRWAHILETSLN